MKGTLHDAIHQLAAEFAAGVLGVIRGASLEDILAETESGGLRGQGRGLSRLGSRTEERKGRLQRRSAADIDQVVNQIVKLLSGKPNGLRAEQIRAVLGLSAKELPRPLSQALAAAQITKTGQKRATTYFARGRAPAATERSGGRRKRAGKIARKSSKRAAPKAKGDRTESSARPSARASEAAASGSAEGN